MFLPTAKEICDSIRETFSKVKDATQIYDLIVKAWLAKKEIKSVTKFAKFLKNWWGELDQYHSLNMKCSKDATTSKRMIENDRAYQFVVGLSKKYNQVRNQILGKKRRYFLMR